MAFSLSQPAAKILADNWEGKNAREPRPGWAAEEKSGMLFHYTDYIAFDGIAGNKELRLNNVLNMNDASEMRFYMDGICRSVVQVLAENQMQEKATAFDRYFRNEFAEEFNYSAYAACFSRFRDDAAQWERYGRSGQGVSISFDEEMLKKITETTHGAVSMREVHYDQKFSELKIVDQFSYMISHSPDIYHCLEEFHSLMVEAWITSAAFKHPSFANEKEVRMVLIPSVSDFRVTPQYHVSLGRIKKYYPVNLEQMCENAGITMEDLIREVMIGPTSTQSPPILKDYLLDKGYRKLGEHIMVSECPLRKPTS